MSDDNKKVLTTEEVKANVITEFGLDPEDETNKVVIDKIVADRIESQKSLSKAIDQKVAYRSKAVEAGLLDPITFEPISKEPKKPSADDPNSDRLEAIDLRSRGYNDEEISVLQKYGGVKALEDPIIMAGITEMRAKSAAEKATIGEDTGGGSEVEKKFTHDQLRDMPVSELEKILPKAQPK